MISFFFLYGVFPDISQFVGLLILSKIQFPTILKYFCSSECLSSSCGSVEVPITCDRVSGTLKEILRRAEMVQSFSMWNCCRRSLTNVRGVSIGVKRWSSEAACQVGDDSASEAQKRVLKIAMIGAPNSGKSTLINQIVQRRVGAFIYH